MPGFRASTSGEWLRLSLALAVMLVFAGCAREEPVTQPRNRPAEEASASKEGDAFSLRLTATPSVADAGTPVILGLRLTAKRQIVMRFSNGMRYDFAVFDAKGGQVWRWSAGRAFTEITGEEKLAAGETRDYSDIWTSTVEGKLKVEGSIAAASTDFADVAELRLQAEIEVTD